MGVEHIIKVIKKEAGAYAIKSYDLDRFDGMTVAVDASSVIYQTVIAIRSSGADLTNRKGELTSHLGGILDKLVKFLDHHIKPIFVFDGKPPEFKNKEIAKRNAIRAEAAAALKALETTDTEDPEYIKQFKKTFRPTKEQIAELKIMLDLIGIPYIQSPGEADVMCAWLALTPDANGKRYAKVICADDSDMLAFGGPYLAKDMGKFLSPGKKITVVSLSRALKKMDMTQDQFVNLCVLLGCDHNDNIPGCGPVAAYRNASDHESLEKIIHLYKKKDRQSKEPKLADYDFDLMLKVRDYFKTAVTEIDKSGFNVEPDNLYLRQIQDNAFIDFMCVKHGFDIIKMTSHLNKIQRAYEEMGIVRPNNKTFHKLLKPKTSGYEVLSSDSEESEYVAPVKKTRAKSSDSDEKVVKKPVKSVRR